MGYEVSYHDRILHYTGFATRPRADVQDACLQIASEADQQIADLQSQLLAQEAAVADAWNAEREELKLRAESAEAKLAEVPQLVAALKQIRTTAEKQIRTRLAGMYGWKTETIDKCVEDNELIQQLDAAIAAGEGRDAERS